MNVDLSALIAITGKPGLYKIVSQTRGGILVEQLGTKKRMPVSASQRISALEDISMYTYEEDVRLADVFVNAYNLAEGKELLAGKTNNEELASTFESVLPDYDRDRVYNSDLKKFFSWYNLLLADERFKEEVEKVEKEEKVEEN